MAGLGSLTLLGNYDALLAAGADVCEGIYSATGGGGGETGYGGRDGGVSSSLYERLETPLRDCVLG
jgi:hypothetical protein